MEAPRQYLFIVQLKRTSMSGSPEVIQKTVTVEVPPTVEERARDQADSADEVELFLLDELEIDIEWRFESKD